MGLSTNYIKAATDSSGNVTGLVGPGGVEIPISTMPGVRAGVIGDSILGGSYSVQASLINPVGTTSSNMLGRGLFNWANALAGMPFNFVYNGGVSGERSDQILARVSTVLSNELEWLFEMCGINDVSQLAAHFASDATACEDAIVTNRTAIWAQAVGNGVKVVALATLPPAAAQAMTLTQKTIITRANRRLKVIAERNGVIWVDAHAAVIDTSLATGVGLAANYYDGLHPSTAGAYKIGAYIATKINPFIKKYDGLVSSPIDCFQQDSTSKNLMDAASGLFVSGTAGTASTGVTGTVATNWTLARTVGAAATAVASIVTAPDSVGSAQRLVITSTAVGDTFRWFYSPGTVNIAAFPAGSQFYTECAVKVRSATAVKTIYLNAGAYFTGGAASSPQESSNLYTSQADTGTGTSDMDLVIRTPLVTLPTDATAISSLRFELYAAFSGAGGATVDVYRCAMIRV